MTKIRRGGYVFINGRFVVLIRRLEGEGLL